MIFDNVYDALSCNDNTCWTNKFLFHCFTMSVTIRSVILPKYKSYSKRRCFAYLVCVCVFATLTVYSCLNNVSTTVNLFTEYSC